MLKDNLKTLRKNKGLSQEELSIKLHVVRQTISKWESGLSVPDAEMLMTISEIFETPVSEILGESIEEKEKNDLKVISENFVSCWKRYYYYANMLFNRIINEFFLELNCLLS